MTTHPALTHREDQVLEACAHGRTQDWIAHRLGVTVRSVRRAEESARAKLGVSTREEAVRVWTEHRLRRRRSPAPMAGAGLFDEVTG